MNEERQSQKRSAMSVKITATWSGESGYFFVLNFMRTTINMANEIIREIASYVLIDLPPSTMRPCRRIAGDKTTPFQNESIAGMANRQERIREANPDLYFIDCLIGIIS